MLTKGMKLFAALMISLIALNLTNVRAVGSVDNIKGYQVIDDESEIAVIILTDNSTNTVIFNFGDGDVAVENYQVQTDEYTNDTHCFTGTTPHADDVTVEVTIMPANETIVLTISVSNNITNINENENSAIAEVNIELGTWLSQNMWWFIGIAIVAVVLMTIIGAMTLVRDNRAYAIAQRQI